MSFNTASSTNDYSSNGGTSHSDPSNNFVPGDGATSNGAASNGASSGGGAANGGAASGDNGYHALGGVGFWEPVSSLDDYSYGSFYLDAYGRNGNVLLQDYVDGDESDHQYTGNNNNNNHNNVRRQQKNVEQKNDEQKNDEQKNDEQKNEDGGIDGIYLAPGDSGRRVKVKDVCPYVITCHPISLMFYIYPCLMCMYIPFCHVVLHVYLVMIVFDPLCPMLYTASSPSLQKIEKYAKN